MKNWTEEKTYKLDQGIILDLEKRGYKRVEITKIFNNIEKFTNIKSCDHDFINYDLKTLTIYKDSIVEYDHRTLKVMVNGHGYIYKFFN